MTNPYASSDAVDIERPHFGPATKLPALLLLLLLVPTLLYDGLVAFVYTRDLLNGFSAMGWSLTTIRRWDWLARGIIILSVHLFVLFGAIRMWQCRSYRIVVATCLLSLVPILTPGFVLGIPVAAFGLVVLHRKSVQSAFQNKVT